MKNRILRVVALSLLASTLVSCKSKEERALEEANRKLAEATERAEKANENYEKVKQTFEDYEALRKKLDDD